MSTESGKSIYLQGVTMIDPLRGWIGKRIVPSTRVNLEANQIELA